jgi:hypothetical protein
LYFESWARLRFLSRHGGKYETTGAEIEESCDHFGCWPVICSALCSEGRRRAELCNRSVGLYYYTGDITRETQLDEAFIGELSYRRYFHPNFVLEAGVGYIHDDHQGDELQGWWPFTLTAIGVYPVEKVRLLGGGGIGVYPMNFDGEINNVIIHGEDTVVGGHVLMGCHWYLRPSGFIGLEGKYLFLEKAKFEDEKVELDGFTMILKLGFRF